MKRFQMDGQVWYGAPTLPIDWWPGWTSIDGLRRDANRLWEWGVELPSQLPPELDTRIPAQVATELGWEGDGEWKCAPLPTDDGYCKLMFAVKQSNNGTTFIVSPFDLPWL